MKASEIDHGFVPAQAAAAYTVELDGEAVVLDEALNRLHHLNPMATLVWACFDGTGTIDEIARDLADAFVSSPDAVRDDVLALARQLGEEGLLEGIEEPSPIQCGY